MLVLLGMWRRGSLIQLLIVDRVEILLIVERERVRRVDRHARCDASARLGQVELAIVVVVVVVVVVCVAWLTE